MDRNELIEKVGNGLRESVEDKMCQGIAADKTTETFLNKGTLSSGSAAGSKLSENDVHTSQKEAE
jgi:hypothetical protein